MKRLRVECVIVNDASSLIDLRKGRLLGAMLKLPHRFVVPFPIRHSELLDFTDRDWQSLDDGGMETLDLAPDETAEALEIKMLHPGLSANDCFCLVTARRFRDSVLLTGDALLRRTAKKNRLRAHGVLWMVDQLKAEGVCADAALLRALALWKGDPSVFLPEEEIEKRISALR